MLVLARKKGQSIIIGNDIKIVLVEVSGETVRLGVEAPPNLEIYRGELYNKLKKENTLSIIDAENIKDFIEGKC